jgi:hypothetical protein
MSGRKTHQWSCLAAKKREQKKVYVINESRCKLAKLDKISLDNRWVILGDITRQHAKELGL